jgi:hypothetical protein
MTITNVRLLGYFLAKEPVLNPAPIDDDQANLIPTALLSFGQHVGIVLRTGPVYQPVPNDR